jgi:hypothetical protein
MDIKFELMTYPRTRRVCARLIICVILWGFYIGHLLELSAHTNMRVNHIHLIPYVDKTIIHSASIIHANK